MSNVKLYYPNLRDVVFTAAGGFTVNASYPLDNLEDGIPENPVKSTVTTDAQRIVIDQGSAKTFDYIALLNHNFTTTDGLRVRCASDAGITTDVETVVSTFTPTQDGDLVIDDCGSFTKRYIAIEWVAGGTLAAVPQLGCAWVGQQYEFSFPWTFGAKPGYGQYQTSRSTSLSGIERKSQAFGGVLMFELPYKWVSDADIAMLKIVFHTLRGGLYNFMMKDHNNATYYVSFMQDAMPWSADGYNLNNPEPLLLKTSRASYGITSGLADTSEVIIYE